MEVTELEHAVEQLIEFWTEQKFLSPPNTLDDMLYFEFSRNIQLPADFRRFFLMTNGMVDLFPNYFDNDGFLFYPLQELTTFEDEFEISRGCAAETCIIFAEYMHKSCWYGFTSSKASNSYEIVIIPSVDKSKVITQNLAEFIHLYMNDSLVLYEY